MKYARAWEELKATLEYIADTDHAQEVHVSDVLLTMDRLEDEYE